MFNYFLNSNSTLTCWGLQTISITFSQPTVKHNDAENVIPTQKIYFQELQLSTFNYFRNYFIRSLGRSRSLSRGRRRLIFQLFAQVEFSVSSNPLELGVFSMPKCFICSFFGKWGREEVDSENMMLQDVNERWERIGSHFLRFPSCKRGLKINLWSNSRKWKRFHGTCSRRNKIRYLRVPTRYFDSPGLFIGV